LPQFDDLSRFGARRAHGTVRHGTILVVKTARGQRRDAADKGRDDDLRLVRGPPGLRT
jgi:hypothetical protein